MCWYSNPHAPLIAIEQMMDWNTSVLEVDTTNVTEPVYDSVVQVVIRWTSLGFCTVGIPGNIFAYLAASEPVNLRNYLHQKCGNCRFHGCHFVRSSAKFRTVLGTFVEFERLRLQNWSLLQHCKLHFGYVRVTNSSN